MFVLDSISHYRWMRQMMLKMLAMIFYSNCANNGGDSAATTAASADNAATTAASADDSSTAATTAASARTVHSSPENQYLPSLTTPLEVTQLATPSGKFHTYHQLIQYC